MLILTFGCTLSCTAREPDWERYTNLLKKYVSLEQHHGTSLHWVDYTRLKSDPDFDLVVKELAEFPTEELENDQELLAFYINAYNIIAIKIVTEHWPVESIKDVGSVIWSVWKRKFAKLNGEDISLHTIEHDILRPMGDSRIHMAIVCASVSCPDIRKEAYTSDKLNKQLNEQTREFLLNKQKGLVLEGYEARVSKIFDWFEGDFIEDFGSVEIFLHNYSNLSQGIKLKYDLPYHWAVNGD